MQNQEDWMRLYCGIPKTRMEKSNFPNAVFGILHASLALMFIYRRYKPNHTTDTTMHTAGNYFSLHFIKQSPY